jgi:1-acyl-sn-glycerol-3-phosphate acyltransferase
MIASLRGVARLTAVFLFIFLCMPVQIVARALNLRLKDNLPPLFHTFLMNVLLGIRVEKRGEISQAHPTLFLCNHLSYLDILGLGGLMPCRFISKAEVAEWPLFGYLAKLQDTVFIERRGRRSRDQTLTITDILQQGKSLVLFPEGTSTNGTEGVRPFKSSLLQAAQTEGATDLTVQPVSIACYGRKSSAHLYPWYGDMTLVPHLWQIAKAEGLHVRFTFHPPFSARLYPDRKLLANAAEKAVAGGETGIISGN